LVFILFKRKWSVLTILATTMLVAVVWLWFIREDVYQISAKILVKIGPEQAPPPTVVGASPPLVVGYRYNEVNSEAAILDNAELLGRVIDKLGLDKPGPPPPVPERLIPRLRYEIRRVVRGTKEWFQEILVQIGLRPRLTYRERVLATLRRGLSVEPLRDSNVFVASMVTPYREGSSLLLNQLLEEYQEFRLRLYQDESVEFFRNEATRSAESLSRAEVELQRYESSWDISTFERQEAVLLDQIAHAQALFNEADLELQEVSSKVARLEQELGKDDPNFGALGEFAAESFPQQVLVQLAELQRERERLRMTELDTGDRLQNNRSQFRALSDMLAANLRTVLKEKQAVHKARETSLETLQEDLRTLHDKQMKWKALTRTTRELEGLYSFYRNKLEEASAAAALKQQHIGNVAIIEHAIDPVVPAGMRKTTLLGLAAMMAIFAALTWVAIAEFFDHRFYSGDDLEKHLLVPVITVAPATKKPGA
jgi:uncharacterized protein involved in exopolysaccharide biosynthesis